MFKLNKLQRSQNPSATNSVTTSPQPAVGHTPSPSQNHNMPRHGHSFSMSNPPIAPTYNPTAAFNPFGPQATLGSDQIFSRTLSEDCPPSKSPISAGGPSSRPLSRPDFTRGFGLDIPEEEEPPEEADADIEEGADQGSDMDLVEGEADVEIEDDSVAMLNRIHSRHVSRLSATLSLRSVGRQPDPLPDARDPVGNLMVDDLDLIEKEADGVAEWTGSEDPRGDSDEVLVLTSIIHLQCFSHFSRRALGSGPTHLTKNVRGKSEGRGGWHAARRPHCKMFLANYPNSHDLLQPHTSRDPIKGRTMFSRIPVTRRRSKKRVCIPSCRRPDRLDTDDRCLLFPTHVRHPLSSHTTIRQHPIRGQHRNKSFPTHPSPLTWHRRFLWVSSPPP